MINGVTYYTSNVHSKAVFPQVSAYIKPGRILEWGRSENFIGYMGCVLAPTGASATTIYVRYGSVWSSALDGSTSYGGGASATFTTWTKVMAEGNTACVTYLGSSRNSFVRIYSNNGYTWGGTEIIQNFGTSYIADFSLVQDKIYYLSGLSISPSYADVCDLRCLVREGTTWLNRTIDASYYTFWDRFYSDDVSEVYMNVFPRENGLDEIFLRTDSEYGVGHVVTDSQIIKLSSDGRCVYDKQLFFKSEKRDDSDIFLVSMKPSFFGASTSLKVLPIVLQYYSQVANTSSRRKVPVGMVTSYSKEYDVWSGFVGLDGVTTALFAGATEGIWHGMNFKTTNITGNTSLQLLTFTESGGTSIDISSYLMSYENNNNERITLELGNLANG